MWARERAVQSVHFAERLASADLGLARGGAALAGKGGSTPRARLGYLRTTSVRLPLSLNAAPEPDGHRRWEKGGGWGGAASSAGRRRRQCVREKVRQLQLNRRRICIRALGLDSQHRLLKLAF